jgi:hypothetical protein
MTDSTDPIFGTLLNTANISDERKLYFSKWFKKLLKDRTSTNNRTASRSNRIIADLQWLESNPPMPEWASKFIGRVPNPNLTLILDFHNVQDHDDIFPVLINLPLKWHTLSYVPEHGDLRVMVEYLTELVFHNHCTNMKLVHSKAGEDGTIPTFKAGKTKGTAFIECVNKTEPSTCTYVFVDDMPGNVLDVENHARDAGLLDRTKVVLFTKKTNDMALIPRDSTVLCVQDPEKLISMFY